MRYAGRFFVVLALASVGAGGGSPTVSVELGRSLDRILDVVLSESKRSTKRTLLLVVDPSPSLAKAGFADAMGAALERRRASLAKTRIGVYVCGSALDLRLEPTDDLDRVAATVRSLLAQPKSAYQDVYADLRQAARVVMASRGRRDLLLISLENGDVFADVEGAAAAVRRAKAKLWIVAREAFLADPYAVRTRTGLPRDATAHSADGAFLDIPWYWFGQRGAAVGAAPSGRPYWAISRLAAVARGRVFLYYPSSGEKYSCTPFAGTCPFCLQDQHPPEYPYNRPGLRALAPHFGRPRAAIVAAVKDPVYRVVLNAWELASDNGLVLGRPGINKSRGRVAKRVTGRLAPVGGSVAFGTEIKRAHELITVCDTIDRRLTAVIKKHRDGPRTRSLAIAELTHVMNRLARLNLKYFIAFCKDVGPATIRPKKVYEGPEVMAPQPKTPTGISSTPMSLSHGVEPFYEMFLPGGEALDTELRAFADVANSFWLRYQRTPFAMVLRRAGIARWRFTGVGTVTGERDPRLPGSTGEDPTTGRPDKPSAPGSSGSGGPTSGGG